MSRDAWTLPLKLLKLKKYSETACCCGHPKSHLIRVLNKRSFGEGRNFGLLWLVIVKPV